MIKVPFKMDFDPQADSMYIRLKDGEYSYSNEKDNVVLDYDKAGELLGIEILDVSENEDILKSLIYSWKVKDEIYIN